MIFSSSTGSLSLLRKRLTGVGVSLSLSNASHLVLLCMALWTPCKVVRPSNLGYIDICVFVFSTAFLPPSCTILPHLFSCSCPPAPPFPPLRPASRAPSNYSTRSSASPPTPSRLPLSLALSPFPSPPPSRLTFFSTPWPRAFLSSRPIQVRHPSATDVHIYITTTEFSNEDYL